MSLPPQGSPARIVVADDSDIAARRIEGILETDPGLRVVRRFSSAAELLAWPDLETVHAVVLDMWMPGLSGLSAVRELAAHVGVVVVSDLAPGSTIAQEALAQGASAFIGKSELGDAEGESRLRAAIRSASTGARAGMREPGVVLVVGSTGAPRAHERLLPALRDLGACVALVQHLPPAGEQAFARWASGLGPPAHPARSGQKLRPVEVLVAPAGRHLLIEQSGVVRLVPGKPTDLHVPSADRALSSAAWLGPRLVAVVLSGMGKDGTAGVADVIAQGGACLVQHPDESAAPSMPRSALSVSARVRASLLDTLGNDVRELIQRRRRGA